MYGCSAVCMSLHHISVLILCVGMLCFMYVYAPHVYLVPQGDQKRALDHLELELLVVVVLETELGSFSRATNIEPSFQPPCVFFLYVLLNSYLVTR